MSRQQLTALCFFSFRQLLAGKRLVLLLVLAAAAVFIVSLSAFDSPSAAEDLRETVPSLLLGLLLPLVSLTLATSALGEELRDGTAPNVLLKPMGRSGVLLAKLLAAVLAGLAVLLPAAIAAHLLAARLDEGRLLAGSLLGTLVGVVAYSALGLCLSLLAERALLLGLAYWLLWESAVVPIMPAMEGTSLAASAKGVFGAIVGETPAASPEPVQAGLVAAIVTLAAFALACERLRRIDLR